MKKILKFIPIFLFFVMLALPIMVNSHTHGGYSHDSSVGLYKPNWMDGLSNNLRINQVSIPGTGHSMAYGNHTDFTLTQSMDLETQLNSGIRFLELEIRHTGSTDLKVVRGGSDLGVGFLDVIKRVSAFLSKNPSETVLIKVSQESSESGTIAGAVRKVLEDSGLSSVIYDGSTDTNPLLEKVRGKIVLLADYDNSGNRWKTIPYAQGANIQDSNYLSNNWDLYSKWEKVKNHLNLTRFRKNDSTRYINFLSGYGGALPYFVASGHVSSGTGDARLSTGLTEPGFSSYYPDFPRVDRFLVFSTIAFEGTNILTTNYIMNNNLGFTGIIVADFPGKDLISSIINANFNTSFNGNNNGFNSSGNNNNSSSNTGNNIGGFGITFK